MSYAPLAVFAYNRKDKIERCLSTVSKCKEIEETDLHIFSDGPKNDADVTAVKEVRDYLYTFKEQAHFYRVFIYSSDKNKGLAKSIIEGVTQVIENYGKIIVLEDDLIVSDDFLHYMNNGLDFYKEYKRYGSINAYSYPIKSLRKYNKDIYVTRKGDCWGWGTWKDRWECVDWDVTDFHKYIHNPIARIRFESLEAGLDEMLVLQQEGKSSSWAVRWVYSLHKRGLWSVYPAKSRVTNIGMDGSGENSENTDAFSVEIFNSEEECNFELLEVDKKLERECANYVRIWRIKQRIKHYIDRIGMFCNIGKR